MRSVYGFKTGLLLQSTVDDVYEKLCAASVTTAGRLCSASSTMLESARGLPVSLPGEINAATRYA